VQWIVVASLVALVVLAGVQLIGARTSDKLNQTASDVANPANLTNHMGR
jgi:outer membrane murein-binding lipoprotein Lpp